MSNEVQPVATITDMTANVTLRFNTDMTIDGKIVQPNRAMPRLQSGSLRIDGVLITITSTTFTRVYPLP